MAWLVIAVPLIMMLFPLMMERVEKRLENQQRGSVNEAAVEEFFEQAQPSEVQALYGHGIGRALEMFRLRRLGGRAAKLRSRKAQD